MHKKRRVATRGEEAVGKATIGGSREGGIGAEHRDDYDGVQIAASLCEYMTDVFNETLVALETYAPSACADNADLRNPLNRPRMKRSRRSSTARVGIQLEFPWSMSTITSDDDRAVGEVDVDARR